MFFLLTLPWAVLAGKDYRFAFFTGVSSIFCWLFLRTTVGLSSLLRLLDCTFNLKNILIIILTMVGPVKQKGWLGTIVFGGQNLTGHLWWMMSTLLKSLLLRHHIPAETTGRPCTSASYLSKILTLILYVGECSGCKRSSPPSSIFFWKDLWIVMEYNELHYLATLSQKDNSNSGLSLAYTRGSKGQISHVYLSIHTSHLYLSIHI